jgi:hypothetical protein
MEGSETVQQLWIRNWEAQKLTDPEKMLDNLPVGMDRRNRFRICIKVKMGTQKVSVI